MLLNSKRHIDRRGKSWWPETSIFKVPTPYINSMLIALLIHGFVFVETWLLKVFGTNFVQE